VYTSSAAIVVMALQQKKLARYFVRAGAFSPGTAVAPELLPRVGSHSLDKLQGQGIVLSTPEGNFYLDQGRLKSVSAAERAETRKMMLIVISIFAVGLTLFTGLAYLLAVA
jgi:hypothetical protein